MLRSEKSYTEAVHTYSRLKVKSLSFASVVEGTKYIFPATVSKFTCKAVQTLQIVTGVGYLAFVVWRPTLFRNIIQQSIYLFVWVVQRSKLALFAIYNQFLSIKRDDG